MMGVLTPHGRWFEIYHKSMQIRMVFSFQKTLENHRRYMQVSSKPKGNLW